MMPTQADGKHRPIPGFQIDQPPHGYVRYIDGVNAELVSAACRAFFARRGMPEGFCKY